MYTPDEKNQIRALEDSGAVTRFTTTIKEVTGGYIITHAVTYVKDDEIVGQTREERVCSGYMNVVEVVADLYGDPVRDMLKLQNDNGPVTNGVPEYDRYASHTNQPGG